MEKRVVNVDRGEEEKWTSRREKNIDVPWK